MKILRKTGNTDNRQQPQKIEIMAKETFEQYCERMRQNGKQAFFDDWVKLRPLKAVERSSKPSEASLERYAKKQVEACGGLYLKFVSPGFTGVPDRICIKPGGEVFFVEHKAPGGKLSERQKVVGEQFRELGATYYVAVSKEDIDEIIKLEFE